jgi:2-dehydro-3-deoxy-D-arabinonate dehydratase
MVPEPELTVICDPEGEIFGYTVGNDLSSRDIEGANPLYLPQAKIFHNSAALGPCIAVAETIQPHSLEVHMAIVRGGAVVLDERTSTRRMRREVGDLLGYLGSAWPLAPWTGLMTGTGIVPPDEFSLHPGDEIRIAITGIGTLRNLVRRIGPAWVKFPRSGPSVAETKGSQERENSSD